MTTKELSPEEYNAYYQPYMDRVSDIDLWVGLMHNHEDVIAFLKKIDKSKLLYRYAVGKWSIKDIIQHLIDTERVFAYRALTISRNDKTALPGFDEHHFAEAAIADERPFESLLEEYKSVRMATITLFRSFSPTMFSQIGTASHSNLSVRAIPFIIIGHEAHHLKIIQERYL